MNRYLLLLFFWYPNDNVEAVVGDFAMTEERSQRLEKSLSEMLAPFYPFAGRIRVNSLFECNDEGDG